MRRPRPRWGITTTLTNGSAVEVEWWHWTARAAARTARTATLACGARNVWRVVRR